MNVTEILASFSDSLNNFCLHISILGIFFGTAIQSADTTNEYSYLLLEHMQNVCSKLHIATLKSSTKTK